MGLFYLSSNMASTERVKQGFQAAEADSIPQTIPCLRLDAFHVSILSIENFQENCTCPVIINTISRIITRSHSELADTQMSDLPKPSRGH